MNETDVIRNPYVVGAAVSENDLFVGRKEIIEQIDDILQGRNKAIYLFGNQRIGKTSILKKLNSYLTTSHICVLIDLSGIRISGIGNFFWQIADRACAALNAQALIIPYPSEEEYTNASDPFRHFNNFLSKVEGIIGNKRLLFLIDETERLQSAVHKGNLKDDIYAYLQNSLQNPTIADWLLSLGSQQLRISQELNRVLQRAVPIEVSFLDRDSAFELITRPVKGYYSYSQTAIDEILDLTSGHPYFIQAICFTLFEHWRDDKHNRVNIHDVHKVLEEAVNIHPAVMTLSWERLSPDEKAVLLALAQTTFTQDTSTQKSATRADIEQTFQKYGFNMKAEQLRNALKSLGENHVINLNEPYKFQVDLFRRWVSRKDLDRMKDELAREVRALYLRHLKERYQWLDFQNLMTRSKITKLPLVDIYIPSKVTVERSEELIRNLALRVRARYLAEVGADNPDIDPATRLEMIEEMRRLATTTYQKPISIMKALSENSRLVILGDPGSGKTTLLSYLAITFAEGPEMIKSRLGLDVDWLPILIPISEYADAYKAEHSLTLGDYLRRHFNRSEPDLHDLNDHIMQELAKGQCLILLDGLDTVIDNNLRSEVARQVEEFVNAYPSNHFIITSRVQGYKEAPMGERNLLCAITDFETDEIRKFVDKWSIACEERYGGDPDRKREAEVKAARLVEMIDTARGVRALAGSPLLLTLIALAYQNNRHFSHRIELLAECTNTLLEHWKEMRDLTASSKDLSNGVNDEIYIFGPLALWMLEEKITGIVDGEGLENKLQQLVAVRADSEEVAQKVARDFLHMERNQTGILVRHGEGVYGFSHLIFQEYFAARAIAARETNVIEKEILSHLHDPRWHNVIRLTIAQIGTKDNRQETANYLVTKIATAHSPYNEVLRRDPILSGYCMAEDVAILPKERSARIRELWDLWENASFGRLRRDITGVLSAMRGTSYEKPVMTALLSALSNEDLDLSEAAADALGRMGKISLDTTQALIDALKNDRRSNVRAHAAIALGRLEVPPVIVVKALEETLRDESDRVVRLRSAESLAYIGEVNQQAIGILVEALNNQLDNDMRGIAAAALASLKTPPDSLVDILLNALRDTRADVRTNAADILGRMGQNSRHIVDGLIEMLNDESTPTARISAAMALGQVGNTSEPLVTALINHLADTDFIVRRNCTKALGKLALKSDTVVTALQRALADKEISVGAANALGYAGRGDLSIFEVTEPLHHTDRWQDRLWRAEAMLSLDKKGEAGKEIIEIVAEILETEPEMKLDILAGTARILSEAAHRNDNSLDELLILLSHESWYVRSAAAEALGLVGKPRERVIEALFEKLKNDEAEQVRGNAATALGALGSSTEEVIQGLTDALHDTPLVSLTAAEALARLGARGCKETLDRLYGLLDNGYNSFYHNKTVRDVAFDALMALAPYSDTDQAW